MAFKIIIDEGRKLTYVRIYSGTLSVGQDTYNATKKCKEKISRIFRMHANKKERVSSARAGEIVAVMGFKDTTTGDTLCDQTSPIILESIEFYKPVISVAVEPRSVGDEEKLHNSLKKISEEDPTFSYRTDEDSGQTLISGMGELHLDIITNKLDRQYNVSVRTGRPQVVYRETITVHAEAEGLFDREIGETRQCGHVRIALDPLPRGAGFSFSSETETGQLDEEILHAIEQAFIDSTFSGPVAGYPLADIKCTLLQYTFTEGASTELGFTLATAAAIKNALDNSSPVLLEPIMEVEIVTPNEFLGDIISDINARKGKIDTLENKGLTRIATALVPLKNMFGYSTALRSASQGRAQFSMKFSQFETVDS